MADSRISQVKADLAKHNPTLLLKLEETLFEALLLNFGEKEIEALIQFIKFQKEDLALFKKLIKGLMNKEMNEAISNVAEIKPVEVQKNHSENANLDEEKSEILTEDNKTVENSVEGILKQKWEALEKIRESFKTEETEELETFVHFKLTARPEAFREMIDHMKYYEEADGLISALSVQESGAENAEKVTENKSPEKLEEERGPSFFVPLIPDTKSPNDGNGTGRKDQKNQNINSENYIKGSNVQEMKETCKFLKFGKCRHGLSGKEPDQEKVCSYNHPPVCREHEKWGKCFDNKCRKYHLKICREFMNNQYCTYGDNCKFWHPTDLKDFRMGHERKEHYSKEDIPTELNNSRVFYGKNHSYLKQQGNQRQHPFLDLNQGQNTQGTFLELMKGHKERQKKISEIVRILEQNKQLLNPQRVH